MTDRDIEARSKSELCRRAEKIACQGSYLNSADLAALSPEESRQVLHDLQVHQIELELQNEDLLRTQEALAAARQRYCDLYDLAPVGYCSVNHRTEIREANLTAAELLNVTRAELVGQPMTRFILAEDQDIYYHHRQRCAAGGAVRQECELRLLRRGQPPFWARLNQTVCPRGDGVLNGSLVISDISEQKVSAAEREQLQAQRRESLGRLAGGVAHNYNNLLGIILGYSELGLELVDKDHPVHSSLQAIHNAAERSAELTRQLLACARRQVAVPQVLDLNQSLAEILPKLRQLIGEQIELVMSPGRDLAGVYFDPFQLDQIMANLAVIAWDETGASGTFSITTACTVLDENFCRTHPGATPGGYVRLTVGDSGRGIDPLLLPQLFEPFFTTKAECISRGLGLSVVYGIIKQNGGYIDVASAIGQGTVFDIYFPKCAAEEPPPLAETADPSVLSREKTILLVEDEPLLMNMVLLMLNKAGYRVLAANSPEKALRLADEYEGEIDLLMTDVMMPGMNGHELAQKLISHLPKLKLLFMSGYPADLLGRQAIFADQACYIQKPFTLQECAGKIKEAIGQV